MDCASYNRATERHPDHLSSSGYSRSAEDIARDEDSSSGRLGYFELGMRGELYARDLCFFLDGDGNAVLGEMRFRGLDWAHRIDSSAAVFSPRPHDAGIQ